MRKIPPERQTTLPVITRSGLLPQIFEGGRYLDFSVRPPTILRRERGILFDPRALYTYFLLIPFFFFRDNTRVEEGLSLLGAISC